MGKVCILEHNIARSTQRTYIWGFLGLKVWLGVMCGEQDLTSNLLDHNWMPIPSEQK